MAERDLGIRLESWRISPACQSRGHDVAWEDAISRLKQVYDTQLERFEGEPITLSVAIHLQEGDHHEIPDQTHSNPQGQGECDGSGFLHVFDDGFTITREGRCPGCPRCQPQDQEGREEEIVNRWGGRFEDGETWRLLIENDSFDGKTEMVVINGVSKLDGKEESFLACPSPDEAREMARALIAYSDAVQKANKRSRSALQDSGGGSA